MEFTIKNHWLYKDGVRVTVRLSPNHGGEIEPEIIVIHYTDSENFQGDINWLCSRKSEVSAHVVIDKDGTVVQLLPFNFKGWHCGRSTYEGRPNCNNFSIGIENTGVGDEWPEAQIQANRNLIRVLYETYNIQDTVGHEEIAPGRKVDPGPNFPWDQVLPDG